jgi:hypothetical protein
MICLEMSNILHIFVSLNYIYMAKAILEFDLNDLDDRLDHKQCIKANDMACVIWEFTYNTKKSTEHVIEGKDGYEVLDLIYDKFFRLLEEHNINIDELII